MKGHSGTEARFALLGPVSADGCDGPIVLGSPKQRTVLAALLLNVNRTVSDDRLIALVWGEQPPRTAISRLQVCVHELRALLGKERVRRLGAGYRLRVEEGELDLELFERHRTAARAHAEAGRHAEAVPLLRAAAALWRGPALAGTSATLIGVLVDRPCPAALRHALKGRDVSIEASYRLPELAALTELAVLERRRGEDEAAARRATQALRLCREIGHASCEERLAPFLQA